MSGVYDCRYVYTWVSCLSNANLCITFASTRDLDRSVQNTSDILNRGEIGQEWAEISQLGVVGVVEPSRNGNRIRRVEDVRSWRVVDDDATLHVSAQLRKVLVRAVSMGSLQVLSFCAHLDVVSLVVVATLPEQSVSDNSRRVQHIQHRIGVLDPPVSRLQCLNRNEGPPWTETQ